MKIRHMILILLEAFNSKIESKTKLQKLMYFLSLLTDENMGFKAHYYGPYSMRVESAMDELIGAGLVEMERLVYSVDIESGFDKIKYKYSLTEYGSAYAKMLGETNSDLTGQIKYLAKRLNNIGNPDYFRLSVAAKAYFILRKENRPLNKAEISSRAKDFGWEVSENDISSAIQILNALGFVKDIERVN